MAEANGSEPEPGRTEQAVALKEVTKPSTPCERVKGLVANSTVEQQFLFGIVTVIGLAAAYPPAGKYFAPEITASWVAVVFIFVLSGMSLKTEELVKAVTRVKFNLSVQVFNLGIMPILIFLVARGMDTSGALNKDLANGMVICAALPMTVNMVIVLSKSAGGDEAAAVFNAAAGNLLGVFVTPAWILALLGQTSSVNFLQVVLKLTYRVLIPIAFGQVLQFKVKPAKEFVKKYKKEFKKLQQALLVFIVYTVFCNTFKEGTDATWGDIILVMVLQGVLLVLSKALAWGYMALLFVNQPRLRIMGMFGCVHKTVAMGIPLLNAIYGDDSKLGLYTLPLLVWHPLQLVIGTALSPKLSAWADAKEQEVKGRADVVAAASAKELLHAEEGDVTIPESDL